MDDLDDYGLTLTHREVEMIMDVLDVLIDDGDEDLAELEAIKAKITQQTGVK